MNSIRSYQDSDYDQMRELVFRSNLYQKQDLEKEDIDVGALREKASTHFDENINDKTRQYLVAVEGDVVIGYVLVETNPVYVGSGALVDFFVIESKRGEGTGTKLIEAGMEWLRSKNIKKVDVAVHRTNEQAIELYRKAGFIDDIDDYVYLARAL